MDVVEQLRLTVERHGMLLPEQVVVVAVSGGPDSITLLHALHTLREKWPISIVAAHLDHGFRGAESAADAEYVREFCDRLKVPVRTAFEDVPAMKKRLHLSSQEAARRARHEFLQAVALEVGAERIALGHTRDDRVETILLNIIRGTGPQGMAGFPPVRLPLVRPLYDVNRMETLDYCAKNGLEPRTDTSNETLDYRRNRLRNELLPEIAKHYNPRIGDALLRLSELVSDESALLDGLAATELDRILLTQNQTEIVLDAGKLNGAHIALQRRVVRLAIGRTRGELTHIDLEAVDRIVAAAGQGESFGFDLPRGVLFPCRVTGQTGRVSIALQPRGARSLDWHVTLPDQGRVELPSGDTIELRVFGTADEAREAFRQSSASKPRDAGTGSALLLPLSNLHLPLTARSWRRGDRMRPRGLGGSKKLQDIFVDRKIPANRRWTYPVIAESAEAAGQPERSINPACEEPDRILGVLGVQGSESTQSLDADARTAENIGPSLLIMALSHRGVT